MTPPAPRRARPPEDGGQVTVLLVGLTLILVALVVVVTNVSRAYLWDRSLTAAADGAAAAAAAGAVDPGRAGARAAGARAAPLDARLARDAVARYLAAAGTAGRFGPGFAYRVDVAGDTVSVTLNARVGLTLVGPLGRARPGGVALDATASARAAFGR